MQAPDGKIAALAGFVIGLAVCGISLGTPSGDPVTVQRIELVTTETVPTAQPPSSAATGPLTPWLPGGGFPSQTPGPEPSSTPTVVAPPVVLERHTAPPRATPHPTPDDDADEPDDDADEPDDDADEPDDDVDEPDDDVDEPDDTDDPED